MQAIILAGGFGSRLSEETHSRPKPMLEVGGHPLIWHICKLYGHFGIRDFVICLGYKGYMIKEYFLNYSLHNSNITVDLQKNRTEVHKNDSEPWRITLVDTGLETMTGGRLARVRRYVEDQTFCLTYGDGLSDINLNELVSFHKSHGKKATITGVSPPGRFGSLKIEGSKVVNFAEKKHFGEHWINGGFFVLEPSVFDLIDGDTTVWERSPLEQLSEKGDLHCYKHEGFWQCIDTLRDLRYVEELWQNAQADWKVWAQSS